MQGDSEVSREKIVLSLVEALRPLDYVRAFWEGGAVAFHRVDTWSDIDAYVLVQDDKVNETFAAVERTLGQVAGIKQKYDIGQTAWPGVFQAFYRLERASEFHVIDLAVLKLTSPDMMLEKEIHGEVLFHFNKEKAVVPPRLDKVSFRKKAEQRLQRLRGRMDMFGPFVQKEINRENSIEAVDLYRVVVLDSLLEVLRMRHGPLHYDFKTRYIHRELPDRVVQRLESLYFVKDFGDLRRKYPEAVGWFKETVREIEEKGLRIPGK